MRVRSALVAALLLLPLGAVTSTAAPAGTAPSDAHVKRAPVSPVVARALGPAGELRDMALNDVQGRTLDATIADFPRMAAEGITSVSAYVYLYVQDPTANEVSAWTLTPLDAELELVADAAHDNGLELHLMPVLLDKQTNTWRGGYKPSDPDAFFASYTAQLVHYAKLATALDVPLFYVGSENQSIAGYTSHWKAAVREVRKHYKGAVSFMSTPYQAKDVRFWDSLDLVSISAYFSMGEDANPTYERFLAAWREVHTPFVRDMAKRLRKPLIYGETGYYAQQHAFAAPHAKPAATNAPAPAAQADGYRALLDVLAQEPNVYGVSWWRWAPATHPGDSSFSPNGKPAECVIAAHWSQDPEVREAATSRPTCDLHLLDQVLATATEPIKP